MVAFKVSRMIVLDCCLWTRVVLPLYYQKPINMISCKLTVCIGCCMFLFLGRQTPPPTVKKSQVTRQPLCRSVGSGFCLPIVPASGPALSLVPSDQSEPLVPASSPSLPLMSSGSDSLKKLLLTFNGRTFYILSDVIAHICDYPQEEKRVALYVNVVKQA